MLKNSKHTLETKQKISESSKGKVKSEKHRRNLSLANKGKHHTEEAKKKISESRKGKKYKPHTLETKQKMSESAKRRFCPYVSEETKQKMSLAKKGKPKSEEFRLKLKNYKKSEEWRKKVSLALKGKVRTEEQKRKLSESKKKLIQELGYIPGWGKSRNTKPELEAENILKKYNLNYKKQFRINYLNSCKFYDFYLPDYNILLEVDGIFWHGKGIKDKDIKSERLKDCRINDKLKNQLAQDNGYTLIRIWEDEMFKLEDYCSSKELFIINKVS